MTPLARKLWRVARILNKSPFDRDLLDHTVPQLDFILAMEAEDHPDQWKFERGGVALASIELRALWENVITAPGKVKLAPIMPSQAVLERAREIAEAANILKRAASAQH